MPPGDVLSDTIEVLLRREAVIARLSAGSTMKRGLADELGVSRSTIDRAVREIKSAGLAAHVDEGVVLTPCGRLAVEEFDQFGTRIAESYGGDAPRAAIMELIVTVTQRSELLGRLVESPLDKRGLVDEFGISRSTVDRTMREFELLDIVEYAPDGFAPTEIGRGLVREYDAFVDRLDEILAASDLLSTLDPGVELDAAMLAGAEIVPREPVASHAPGTRLMELLRDAD